MQKKFFLFCVLFLAVVMIFSSFSKKVSANSPYLSLAGTGDGNSVQINITGANPSTSVLFFYTKSGSGQQITSIGTTDTNGTLTTTISSSSYGISSGSSVYVAIGSINGPQSNNVAWPAAATMLSSSNMLSLSQTGFVLVPGQSSTVTASNLGSSSLYQSSNSNPQIANFSINGSQITMTASSYGSTTGTFCLINNTANCGSVYVIVQNSTAQPLTFSQSSVSISSGQTLAIQIYGGSGSYSVINNSSQNGGTVQTSISDSIISLTTGSTAGSSSITVCSTNMISCGIINVTIGTANSSAVSFSQSSPTVTVAQSLNISIFGPANSLFYVASNSNPSIVQANLSGSVLTLLPIANGSSVLSVCASAANCGSLTVTVNSNSANNGNLVLSQDSVILAIGQTANVTISGGSMPYNILSTANNIFQPTLNTNILTLYGVASGSSSMNVCSADGHCLTLSVTVNGLNAVSTLPAGYSSSTGYSQTTGSPCGTVPSNVVVNIPVDCTGALYSISTGAACPSSTVNIQTAVTPPPSSTVVTTPVSNEVVATPKPVSKTSVIFKFTKSLKSGSKGSEVLELQKKLKVLGFYSGKLDGGFGPITKKAVQAFQKAHKLSQVGSVGPQTRALLNK